MARTEDGGAIGRAIRWRFRQRMDWLHHVDLAQPRDRGLPKVHDICLYGTLHAGTYPLRELDLRMSDAAILATIHAALADRGRVAAMTRSLRADVLARCEIPRSRETFWARLRDFARPAGRRDPGGAAR